MAHRILKSCTENIKQSISLIEDTLRRRAELVSSIGASVTNIVSLSSPARSSFLSVFHGFLSKYVFLSPLPLFLPLLFANALMQKKSRKTFNFPHTWQFSILFESLYPECLIYWNRARCP